MFVAQDPLPIGEDLAAEVFGFVMASQVGDEPGMTQAGGQGRWMVIAEKSLPCGQYPAAGQFGFGIASLQADYPGQVVAC